MGARPRLSDSDARRGANPHAIRVSSVSRICIASGEGTWSQQTPRREAEGDLPSSDNIVHLLNLQVQLVDGMSNQKLYEIDTDDSDKISAALIASVSMAPETIIQSAHNAISSTILLLVDPHSSCIFAMDTMEQQNDRRMEQSDVEVALMSKA